MSPRHFVWSLRQTAFILLFAYLAVNLSDRVLYHQIELLRNGKAREAALENEIREAILAERKESWEKLRPPLRVLGIPIPRKSIAFCREEEVESYKDYYEEHGTIPR